MAWAFNLMNKPDIVPVFVVIFEEALKPSSGLASLSVEEIIGRLRSELSAANFGEKLEIVLVAYTVESIEPTVTTEINSFEIGALHEEVKPNVASSPSPCFEVSRFSTPESAFMAVAAWNMQRAHADSPLFILHVTYGQGAGSARVERASGMLKTAVSLRGWTGCVCNLLLTNDIAFLFPTDEDVATQSDPTVKSLFRMSSPLGNMVMKTLGALAITRPATARCFEAIHSVSASSAVRIAASFFSNGINLKAEQSSERLRATAFLMPKEGDALDQCEDVVSLDTCRNRFAISDGATTASYSAEWARALCQHSIETPPPTLACDPSLSEESRDSMAIQLKAWLDPVIRYWSPEIPWERLLRPAMFNKAKEGAGATIAGLEFLTSISPTEWRFRGWAIGDSCVIHLRHNQLLSSRPMSQAAQFNYDPKLLMTRQGYEKKYVLFWQSWEASMTSDDVLLLTTDAFAEFVLKRFETATQGELICLINDLLSCTRFDAWQRFQEFVRLNRKQENIKNDDVGLIVIKPQSHAC
jgi:hypothetical protein